MARADATPYHLGMQSYVLRIDRRVPGQMTAKLVLKFDFEAPYNLAAIRYAIANCLDEFVPATDVATVANLDGTWDSEIPANAKGS